ncbi:MAG: 50S ribosomal protein L4 [Deltaproteobacteria bacterium]|nr:50S ribosomal protein L4 [Deltaproteobacteria bacterium]MBW2070319.1 50S ribosomal protein L4 [Deltaproteobacteria bacterium]
MPTLAVFNNKKEQIGEIQLKDEIFAVQVKPHILHQIVTMQLAKRRAGSASTKSRSEVRGSRRKPWRQKGTGRARAGTRQSPLWRGGGVAFGPKPRDYTPKVNKKIRREGLKMALSDKCQNEQMVILDSFALERIKTRDFLEVLQAFETDNALIVVADSDEKLELSARNVPYVNVLRTEGLNVYDILRHEQLILMQDAVAKIESALLS